jgi:hypothetical protein
MKYILPGRSMLRRISVLIIFIAFVQLAFVNTLDSQGQGWTFTFQLAYSGACGGSLPSIPPVTVPMGIPTLSECNALRQAILNISVTDGKCTVYYTCTPCTGSDIKSNLTSSSAPGSASVNGLTQGTAFFSPHESAELQKWVEDYLQRMNVMAKPGTMPSTVNLKDVPLTKDNDFNKYYIDQTVRFEKPEQGGVVDFRSKSIIPEGKVVPLLRGQEEEKNKKSGINPVPELKNPPNKTSFIEDVKTVAEEMKDTKLVTWATVFPVVDPIAEKYLNPFEYMAVKYKVVEAAAFLTEGGEYAAHNAFKIVGGKVVGAAGAIIDVAESLTQIYSAYKVADGEISLINSDIDRTLQLVNKNGKLQKQQVAQAKNKVK